MTLPDFPPLTDDILAAIAARHGLAREAVRPMPQVGTFNAIFALGDGLILRVPRDHPRFTSAARNEGIAVPLARAAGVRTPRLVTFDDSLDLLPVPYSVYERVAGTVLEHVLPDPAIGSGVDAVWANLGRDLARLHAGVERQGSATTLIVHEDKTDPRPLPQLIAEAGYFGAAEARWFSAWLDHLAPHQRPPAEPRFLHGDSQATNLMVTTAPLAYAAVIDWGSCLWGDPAFDFAGVPLRAVPAMLAGYRELAVLDDTVEARILCRQLQIGLHQLRGAPKPTWSWAERPMGIPFEALRFFLDTPDDRFMQWAPPRLR